MSRKAKRLPRRWLTARNLLLTHLACHVVFVFGYWSSVAASLSFSDLDFLENHLFAYLLDASSNHFGLLLVLVIHTLGVVAHGWWKGRKQSGESRQIDSELGHLTADEKLELLLDEVVELREGLHEREVVNRARNPDLAAERLREHDNEADHEINLHDQFQAGKTIKGS